MCLAEQVNSTAAGPEQDAPTEDGKQQVLLAVKWVGWVLGLALLWYVLGFASGLARDNLDGAPQGRRLALPLYPLGYARLFLGAFVASTLVGLIGRRVNRVVPAVALAATLAWLLAHAALTGETQSRVYGNAYLLAFGTFLLVAASLVGIALGVWGARVGWRCLVALSVLTTVVAGYLLGVITDVERALSDQPAAVGTTSQFARWMTLALLFGLAVAISTMGKPAWLLLTAAASVALPVFIAVLGYLGQLIRPGVGGRLGEAILAPVADLVPELLTSSNTWWPALAVLAGGIVGVLVRLARRRAHSDVPVLEPAKPVTAGDPGGRTPRRGDHDV